MRRKKPMHKQFKIIWSILFKGRFFRPRGKKFAHLICRSTIKFASCPISTLNLMCQLDFSTTMCITIWGSMLNSGTTLATDEYNAIMSSFTYCFIFAARRKVILSCSQLDLSNVYAQRDLPLATQRRKKLHGQQEKLYAIDYWTCFWTKMGARNATKTRRRKKVKQNKNWIVRRPVATIRGSR
jgi:hypothetical protein